MPAWTTKKTITWVIVGVVAIPVIWFGFWGIKLLVIAKKEGFLDGAEKRAYEGNSMENLKDIHTALMLYQDSEGALPPADAWMDAAWSRLQTADMTDEEARKKLKSEGVTADDEYGYAFNDAAGGKHTLDLKDPDKTPLVFDSSSLAWNAHGSPKSLTPSPARPSGNKVLMASGTVTDAKQQR